MARRCIRRGDNIAQTDEEGWSPPLRASGKGHVAIVKILLKSGANIAQANNMGAFLLCYVCSEGFLDVARLLLDHRANPAQAHKSESHFFALIVACHRGYLVYAARPWRYRRADNEGRPEFAVLRVLLQPL